MDGLKETGIKECLVECKIDKLAKVVTLKQQMMTNDYHCFFKAGGHISQDARFCMILLK